MERATATFDFTDNMRPIGFSAREVPLDNFKPETGVYNSDLAFWGDTAIQGTYAGFRLIDVDDQRRSGGDHRLGGLREPDEHGRQPGRRDRVGPAGVEAAGADHPVLELADAGAEGEPQ